MVIETSQSAISDLTSNQKLFIKIFAPISGFIAGLCCFTPVVLVFFGLSTISYAAGLSDVLYGQYHWVFLMGSFIFLGVGIIWYLYTKENICSLDDIKRERNLVLNFLLMIIIWSILIYILWFYVIVEIMGILLGIW